MADIDYMSDEGKWINFRRQRRNFVLIAFFMFSLAFTGSSIKTLSLLGNTINVGDDFKVSILLWTIFMYFWLRYYYAHKEINDHSMQSTFQKFLMKSFSESSFIRDVADCDMQDVAKKVLEPKLAKDENLDDYKFYPYRHEPKSSRDGNLWTITTNWAILSEEIKTGHVEEIKTNSAFITVNYTSIKWEKIKAWFKTMTTRYYFTEYYVPYYFGIITQCLAIYMHFSTK